MKKYILIDNGHASTTPGKRSPKKDDGSILYEWKWNREAAKMLATKCKAYPDVVPILLVPEDNVDIGLSTRAARANKYIQQYGASNCVFVSVHVNAAGNGGWMNATGWSAWTTKGKTNSDKLAECMYEEAEKTLLKDELYKAKNKIRYDWSDGDKDWESNFTVIYKTNCPAVLVENLFMDNKTDVEYLESAHGKDVLTDIMLKGCLKYFDSIKK